MKKTIIILLAAFALASCATNRARETAAVSGTVFDHALEGVPSSYRDFVGRGGGYFATGPEEALGPDAADGWKRKCVAGLRENGEYAYIIKYLESDEAGAIEYIDIYGPTSERRRRWCSRTFRSARGLTTGSIPTNSSTTRRT